MSASSEFGKGNQHRREDWIKNQLLEIPADSRILDAGAGELYYKKYALHLNYIAQDFGQYNGTGNEGGLQMQNWDNSKLDIISDITSIPVPDKSFDAVMCIEVFEHIPDPVSAIKEFSRLLKQGGKLILTAPFCSLTHFAPFHFYSGFNRFFFEKYLLEYGFRIDEITPNGNFFEYLAQEIQFRIPNKYAEVKITESEKKAIHTFLKMLQRMDMAEQGSSEILCFGYNVSATKL
jgi:ubiquinone/menaquinone biosynthesis C-methylase UbiE